MTITTTENSSSSTNGNYNTLQKRLETPKPSKGIDTDAMNRCRRRLSIRK